MTRWTGRLCSVAGLVSWMVWIGWRVATLTGVVGFAVLVLEVVAFVAALVLTLGSWNAPGGVPVCREGGSVPVRWAGAFGVDLDDLEPAGPDDTDEIAIARHGLALLRRRPPRPTLRELAWIVLATEGIRRLAFVAALVVVLLTGRFPFPSPPPAMLVTLVLATPAIAIGLWLATGGALRPGDRLAWSMASIGAGLGDGTSRSGLPIRWAATMATMVVLNVAVSLRGVSDRWTHGLGTMAHDERIMSMIVASWLVATGLVALRSMPQPVLAPYGATRRLEEGSTRRLALGATFAVAALGLAAGMLPGAVPA